VCYFFVDVVNNKFNYDDSLDVFGVYCIGGIIGALGRQASWLSYQTPVALFLDIAVAEIWRGTAIVMVIIVAGLNQV
ncbi:hypothetical protein AB9F41_38660, partial [Rhizobium leguminosarum]